VHRVIVGVPPDVVITRQPVECRQPVTGTTDGSGITAARPCPTTGPT
jgi:hypothetical protein